MSERIDHYAAAVSMLKDAEMAKGMDLIAVIVQGAQVHATLALVEQQRAANLLRVQENLSSNRNYELASELWVDQIKEVLGL